MSIIIIIFIIIIPPGSLSSLSCEMGIHFFIQQTADHHAPGIVVKIWSRYKDEWAIVSAWKNQPFGVAGSQELKPSGGES